MKPFQKFLPSLLAAAAGLSLSVGAQADTTLTRDCTLCERVNDKLSLVVGDKEFSNFDRHARGFFDDATGLDFTGPFAVHPGETASAELTCTIRVLDPS